MTHVYFSPKKDSGSNPTAQTREGTTLLMWFRLEECGSNLRNVVRWRGVSPKILATIKLLSPGLLGGTVVNLWKPRSIKTCMA